MDNLILEKKDGLAVVTINRRDHYLGEFDSPGSWEKYHRLIAEWLAGQDKPPKNELFPENQISISVDLKIT